MIRFLQNAGHEVIAIAPRDAYSDRLSKLCNYVELPMDNKGTNPLKDYNTYRRFKKTYRELNLDLVLQYTIKPNIYGSMAAQSLGIPTINNVSGLGTIFIRKNLTSKIAIRLYQKAFKKANYTFFQNPDDLKVFEDLNIIKKQPRAVLPGSGVNLNLFHPVKTTRNDNLHFLMVARLLFDKGILEYLEAAEIVKKKHPSVIFQICGFIETVAGLGISKSELLNWQSRGIVEYLGSSDDIKTEYAKADVIVLPSYREGTPKTLLEGAAMGKPLITTNTPGCKEVVIQSYNGLFCEAKSSRSLADSMINFIELSPKKRDDYGTNSRILAEEKFDENLVFSAYKKVIDEL